MCSYIIVLKEMSWDELLDIRSKVFLMESDVVKTDKSPSPVDESGAKKVDAEPDHEDAVVPRNDSESSFVPEGVRVPTDNDIELKEVKSEQSEQTPVPQEDESPKPKPVTVIQTQQEPESSEHAVTDAVPVDVKQIKSMCQQWMDELFHDLYEDLRVFTAWLAQESEMMNVPHSSADLVLYVMLLIERNVMLLIERDAMLLIERDVMCRIGDLCERLQKIREAEHAYRKAVTLEWSTRGWLQLLELFSTSGRLKEAIEAADKVLTHYHKHLGAGSHRTPPVVTRAICLLVTKHGLSRVRNIQESLGLHDSLLNAILLDCVRWRIKGYDS